MDSSELRKKFLDFFEKQGHTIIPGASLVPENDPTVLFTTAGMHPLVPFLLGERHPAGKMLANAQKCIRTNDIDEVGDDVHLTFFEMLGNWSLGDYWKKEAIEWSFEFLTNKKWLGIPIEKLSVTVFSGDENVPRDEETAKIWQKLGIPKKRIYFFGRNDNWWGPAGRTGPCGPDTEMFYWTGNGKAPDLITGDNKSGWVEIWNDVFMEYNKTGEGKFEQLKQKNVDTGMGLERTLAVLNGCNNVFETELFLPIVKKIKEIAEKDYKNENVKAYRIITDHLRAATFILSERVEPSNIERGYVLRRLIRRAIRYGRQIGIKGIFTFKIAQTVMEMYKDVYPELKENKDFIEEQLIKEEEKFEKTLKKGLKEFERVCVGNAISGQNAFNLYQTYGFPVEMTEELAKEKNLEVDLEGFKKELAKHQELSRTASAGMFKSGLADHSDQVIKYHTATHLLLAALRQVLGENVMQRGSNITSERLRFDFSHSQKMTLQELKKTEEIVNQKIKENLKVKWEEMPIEEAKAQGAMGVFGEKYAKIVKVYTIFNEETGEVFSKEICGGPHVNFTSELGRFKIIKEESSSAGVRRIKAILK